MVSQGEKRSKLPIVVFFGTFYPLTPVNLVQTTWNIQRRCSWLNCISCVRIMSIEAFLRMLHSFFKKIEKRHVFGHFLWQIKPPNFSKKNSDDLKFFVKFLLNKFYTMSKNYNHSTFCICGIPQKKQVFSIFLEAKFTSSR